MEEAEKIKVNMSDLLDNKYSESKSRDLDSTPALLRKEDEPKKKSKGPEIDLNVIGVDKKFLRRCYRRL